jgi:hypothetical protein
MRKKTAPADPATATGAASAAATDFIRHVRLAGSTRGLVKNLRSFSKKRHSVPDFASAAATAFLGKLCADELAADAEAFFQKARAAFAYKRKDISLDVASPAAVLTARHFTLEWAYALDENAPSEWTLTHTLHTLNFGAGAGASVGTSADAPASAASSKKSAASTPTADTPAAVPSAAAFDELFAGMFDSIVFALTKGARVVDVIDAVESLDSAEDWTNRAPLTVTYPSDCSACTLRVAEVAAEAVFTGGELSMVFPRAGSPRELIEAFVAVRQAFAFTRHPALAALL